MKCLTIKKRLTITAVLILWSSIAFAQYESILNIFVGDDQGSMTYEMIFGNHIDATWGMNGQKDTLSFYLIEKESPPLPPGLGVVWRPSRSGVDWGNGFLKFDIKQLVNEAQKDTYRLYFANVNAPDADITIAWWDAPTLRERCTAMTLRIGALFYDMFAQSSLTIPDAGDNGINEAYIYKTGAIPEQVWVVKPEKTEIPEEFRLSQNYPNPQNPTSTITYDLPKASYVTLNIYNTLGQQVASLVNEQKQSGRYDVRFDGSKLPSGVYFYRLTAGEFIQTKKMVIIK